MNENAFIQKKEPPTENDLAAALGTSKLLWDALRTNLVTAHGLEAEWSSYSLKAGWSMKLKLKKRTIVYLIPCTGRFLVGLVFGDRALAAAYALDLPAVVLAVMKGAKKYAEGTGFHLEVNDEGDIRVVERLVAIKLEY